jgi:hypothetical protein
LPPGRFLKYGDVIKEGDLWLYKYAKSEPVISRNVGNNVLRGEEICRNWYRPYPINNDYYYLKVGDVIQKGDQWTDDHKEWHTYDHGCTQPGTEHLSACNAGRCRRKIVKPVETKFKVGQSVKILHAGRKGEIGKVFKVLEKDAPESWRNFVLVVGGDTPKYADHELELVDVVEKKPAKKASKYRELEPTEVIKENDQYYTCKRGWKKVGASVGYIPVIWPSCTGSTTPGRRFRRKVS